MTRNQGEILNISYVGDASLKAPENVFLTDNVQDYVSACHLISQSPECRTFSHIWTRSMTHYIWLQDFANQIGSDCIFEKKTARQILSDNWNVTIPDWLEDDDVVSQGLLDLPVQGGEQSSFSNRLLSYFLGDIFIAGQINSSNLAEITKSLVSDETKSLMKNHPILIQCLQEKCEEWKQNSVDNWAKQLAIQFSESCYDVWQLLTFWACLNSYPDKILEYVLPSSKVVFVKKIPVAATSNLSFEPVAKEQIHEQLRIFFDNIQSEITSRREFLKILGLTSGLLVFEFHSILRLLGSNQFEISNDDLVKIRNKFEHCSGINVNQLKNLRQYVKPPYPKLLKDGQEWSEQEWIDWTVNEYTPYRQWQVDNRQYDEAIENTVKCFSHWYINEYAAIHKESSLSLIHSLKAINPSDCKGRLVMVVLVDCLPVGFYHLLDTALVNIGFSQHEMGYRFAPLPTATEYSKPLLLSGEWDVAEGSYAKILKQRAEIDWKGLNVQYLSNLKALSELPLSSEGTIAVLNLLDCDELLHTDVESKNTSYDDELYTIFTRLANTIHQLSETWTGPRDAIELHIITDHGACAILDEEKCDFDSTVVSNLFPDEYFRFASVKESETGNVPANLWELGHRFKHPFVASDLLYFLPNGHCTVRLPSKKMCYLHGGATPEEVIVPTALYKKVALKWSNPALRFLDLSLDSRTGKAKFYIQRVIPLQIEIMNPNSTDMKILRSSIISPDTDLKDHNTPTVCANKENVLRLDCYFKKAALEKDELEIEISYEIAGQTQTIITSIECEFRSATQTGFSLKDL